MRTNWIVAILSLLMIIAALMLVTQTVGFFGGEAAETVNPQQYQDYRYHFVLIAQTTEEGYWRQVLDGSGEICRRAKIALESYGPKVLDPKELERYLEMAILSGVDGILIDAPNDPTFRQLIDEATAKRIPVVALASHLEPDRQISFVGISSYDLGYQTGQALRQAVADRAINVALLVNSNFSAAGSRQYLTGFKAAILPQPKIAVRLVMNSKGESLSAEEQTQSIIKNHPEIGAIICSDSSDTLGVAKLVVDLNQVSRITIIGCGLTPEIANYIRRGVIQGVMADDPSVLGAQGVSTLLRLKQGLAQQEVYHMPLTLVTSQNVDMVYHNFNHHPVEPAP